jgi:hypothetical protein
MQTRWFVRLKHAYARAAIDCIFSVVRIGAGFGQGILSSYEGPRAPGSARVCWFFYILSRLFPLLHFTLPYFTFLYSTVLLRLNSKVASKKTFLFCTRASNEANKSAKVANKNVPTINVAKQSRQSLENARLESQKKYLKAVLAEQEENYGEVDFEHDERLDVNWGF